MNTEQQALLHVSLIEGIGPETIKKLIDHAVIAQIYDMRLQEFISCGVRQDKAALLMEHLACKKMLDEELLLLEKHEIKTVSLLDSHYPEMLHHIHYPPVLLYYKGADFFQFQKNIAIIGSRKANGYAQEVVDAWVPLLVQSGWCVVSGGAVGADAMAHQATVTAHGRTVAILGSGLLSLYPRANVGLFDEIVETGGALVSSFPLRMGALPGNFPARNRIISGLSSACLVLQAAKKSGASITAEFALEQGRAVYAVPGSIFDSLHEGCHALIGEGATLIASAEQLLQELGEAPIETQQELVFPLHEQEIKQPPVQRTVVPQNNKLMIDLEQYSEIERTILRHCMDNAVSTDELLQLIGSTLDELYDHLFNLQLAGALEQDQVGCWKMKR